jgi:3-phosphoshikimate 1-carboxyvinyltransferase
MPVASAQVKSSIILAALHCEDESIIKEKSFTRNHTEIMLGLPVENSEGCRKVTASKKYYPVPADYFIPGDISSAAFFIVLTLLTEGSSLIIKDVLLNKTRTGILDIFKKMGGKINITEQGISAGEVYGDIFVVGSKLKNIPLPPEFIPGIIDEIPALTIAGIFAEGDFEIRNAAELRIKESDRINSIIENLYLTDLNIEEFDDGFRITGHPGNKMPVFDSFGDHRIAMTFSIFSMLLESGGTVNHIESYNISNPDFLDQINKLK